jgi:hypothetical protein
VGKDGYNKSPSLSMCPIPFHPMACLRKNCKGKTGSSWRDNSRKTVYFAATCMDSIARKLVFTITYFLLKKSTGIITKIE